MKNCDEMTKSLIERRDEYLAEQKKKRKTAAKILAPVASFCIVALIGIGAWKLGIYTTKPPVADGEIIANTNEKWNGENEVDEPIQTPIDAEGSEKHYDEDTAIEEPSTPPTPSEDDPFGGKAQGWGDAPVDIPKSDEETAVPVELTTPAPVTDDCALMWWKNKFTVYGSLYRVLTDTPDTELAIRAEYRPAVVDVTNFRYEGKTLLEWYEYDNDQMYERMWTLYKIGDELKYGEALYTEGSPEGYKWDKNLYAEQVAYFGEELINEYIKNGEFDSERLKADIDAYEDNDVKMYPIAYSAYLASVMPKCAAKLTSNNVRCALNADNTLTIYVTAAQFENLPLDDLGNWTFRLAGETNAPSDAVEATRDD